MTREQFLTKSYWDINDRVYRWRSNDNIPFEDLLKEQGVPSGIIDHCNRIRDEETATMMEQYRQRWRNLSAEERAERDFELRAAFGPGEDVVDVISGERFRT